MGYELFWKLNPKRLQPFYQAYKKNLEVYKKQTDLSAWLSGVYVKAAIIASTDKKYKYPEKPMLELQEEKEDDHKRAKACADMFAAQMAVFNQRRKQKE